MTHIDDYVVVESASVLSCLVKIDANQRGTVFVVDASDRLVGVLSDGDFRRWLMATQSTDLKIPVREAMNRRFIACAVNDVPTDIALCFKDSFELMPLLDNAQRLVSIAIKGVDGIDVNGRTISQTMPSFVIAEIGNNHNGSVEHAKELIDAAIAARADCVKFQMRDMQALFKNNGKTRDDSADLGAQYVFSLLEKFQLRNEELIECFDYCKAQGVTPLCTPWDEVSLGILEDYGMPAYKVASADFTNLPFLKALLKTDKPLFCSTGMCTEAEIANSIAFLNQYSAQYVVLHCNSTYPAPLKDVNLRYLDRLRQLSGGLVGYSGHELGIDVPIAAVAMGARVVEKHFTLDKSMEGNDHKISLLPDEFAQMVTSIRMIEQALGDVGERTLSQGEMMNRETLAKSLVCCVPVKKGERITRNMIEIKSPGQGLQPYKLDELLGKTALRDIEAGDFFFQTDIDGVTTKAGQYSFDRPFGVPVRYHDYDQLKVMSNLNLVEFHLSFQDMEASPNDFFTGQESFNLAVHAPELFANDHIIDLASRDSDYLTISRSHLQAVIKVTQRLKLFFPKTECPVIVLNAGGFSDKDFLPRSKRALLYDQIACELQTADQMGVEVIIQSMPPFPWHFGGQRYHNLFVDPHEIAAFCRQYKHRICLDISHAMMACHYYGWSLSDYIAKVGAYTAHIHISDASGDSGEGAQMGAGDVDFKQLGHDLAIYVKSVPFIPEVWQGHKNSGEGFWQALAYLEPYLSEHSCEALTSNA